MFLTEFSEVVKKIQFSLEKKNGYLKCFSSKHTL